MNQRTLTIAGLDFLFAVDSSIQLHFPASYRYFIDRPLTGKLAGSYTIVPPSPFKSASNDHILWSADIWRLRKSANAIHLDLRSIAENEWRANASFSNDFVSGQLHAHHTEHNEDPVYVFNYPTDQVSIMHRLTHLNSGLVHGCGVLIDGNAYVFCGKSGAGKTTIARLWRDAGATIMNDDRIVIRIIEGEPWAASTPWHGDEKEVNASFAPLAGVYHLQQAETNACTILEPGEAVARLMATTIAPFYSRDGVDRIMATWETALREVPSHILRFTPDQRSIDCCRIIDQQPV